MTKDKLQSLTKYAADMKTRLVSAIPYKWSHCPETYKAFLERELRLTNLKIEAAKFSGVEQKSGK